MVNKFCVVLQLATQSGSSPSGSSVNAERERGDKVGGSSPVPPDDDGSKRSEDDKKSQDSDSESPFTQFFLWGQSICLIRY